MQTDKDGHVISDQVNAPFTGPYITGTGLEIDGCEEGIVIGKGSSPTFDVDGISIKNARRAIVVEGQEDSPAVSETEKKKERRYFNGFSFSKGDHLP